MESGCDDNEEKRRGSSKEEHEKGGVISPSDTIVHPLAVVVAPVDAVITLRLMTMSAASCILRR
jgi:hypothetical protein